MICKNCTQDMCTKNRESADVEEQQHTLSPLSTYISAAKTATYVASIISIDGNGNGSCSLNLSAVRKHSTNRSELSSPLGKKDARDFAPATLPNLQFDGILSAGTEA